jgi:hypothetical protein
MDVVVWLRSLGLGKYEAAFRENEIDETVLPRCVPSANQSQSIPGNRDSSMPTTAKIRYLATASNCPR